MGVVYRAYDRVRRQHIALKTLSCRDPEQIYWLKTEFRSLADVRHRNLVELYELVVDDTHCFFTMELLDGVDFAKHVAGPPSLRDCVRQLVEGVQAIHNAGKLHRDLKPSNVLVTTVGRVVVLDFGLSVPLRPRAGSAVGEVAGTLAYMSPEQLRGEALTAASDWYSVGVMLYEVVTGDRPFGGIPLARQTQTRRWALGARLRAAGAPEHLASLTAALLAANPDARPGPATILGQLEMEEAIPARVGLIPAEVFVGRLDELHRLRQSFESAEAGAFVAHVVGESGIGKTALLERFTADLEADDNALVLRGRCHPHESVPYKALDGVLDDLTTHLVEQGEARAIPVTADVGALLQLFPVLGRVPAFAACPAAAVADDPVEMRRRGAGGLRTLLTSLSADGPVVVWIDDLQWGDADSAALLRAVLGAVDPPHILLLLSYRSEDTETSPLLKEIGGAPLERDPDRRLTIQVPPLSSGEARIVARRLLPAGDRDEVADIAREAGGSPFLISQLVRHRLVRRDEPRHVPPRLEDVMRERLETLDGRSRRILDVICLAAAPLTAEAALEVARLPVGARGCISMMRSECLLRLDPHGERSGIQPYHDRIRESVVARVEPTVLRAYHRSLAEVFAKQPGCDPEALFTHYLGAGDARSALPYVEKAAARAAETLAFDRAAQLYARAIDLTPPGEQRVELLILHGEALTNSRRTVEAGQRFMEAANLLAGREPDNERVSGLRRRAAESFLRGGRYEEGERILRGVLEAIKVGLPQSDRQALLRALIIGLPYKIGDIRRRFRHGKPPSPETANRIEVLWGASLGLVMTNYPLAAYLAAKFVREAFRIKDTAALVRAIAQEAMIENTIGGSYFQRRAQRLLAVADRLVEQGADPWTTGYPAAARGVCAWFDGRWRAVLEHYGQAHELVLAQSRRHGWSWELAVGQVYLLSALSFLGDMSTLSVRLEAALQDAMERGDLFAANHYRVGQQSFCRLAADDPHRVLALAGETRATMPPNTFHTQRYHLVTITTQCHLYLREPSRAWETIDEAWRGLTQAQFLRLTFPRAELLHLRGRAALALAESLRSGSGGVPPRWRGWTPRALVGHAARLARRIRRVRTLPARPFAAMIEAGVEAARGDVAAARARLEDAIEGFRVAEMLLYREAARVRLGRLIEGDRGRALAGAALSRLAEQTKRPEAIVWTLAPGLGEGDGGSLG
jgi:serine/threonine protein kinase/tetratricopeptide (TPR) repeat protein